MMLKLAICIPTHHGRAGELRELLDSIVKSEGSLDGVQVCVSDNASADGTQELVRGYIERHGRLFKYHRNDANTGIRNFFTVVEMADAEYCWMIGSDDAVPPGGIGRVLAELERHPRLPAITVNKLNYNKDLTRLIGPDHDVVLPPSPREPRVLRGYGEIVSALFMLFGYIGAHVFRKELWDEVIGEHGLPHGRFPNQAHVFMYCEIARRGGEWLWVADPCVIQRLENFSFVELVSDKPVIYANEQTSDFQRLAATFAPDAKTYRGIMRRVFIVYWNPWYALKYRAVTPRADWNALHLTAKCVRFFRHDALFWLLTFPILILPRFAARALYGILRSGYEIVAGTPQLQRVRGAARAAFHRLMRLMGIEK